MLATIAMLVVKALPSYAATSPQQDMQRLDAYIEQATTKAESKDFQGSAASFKKYEDDWFDVEDGVKKTSSQAYKEIESTMGEIKFALLTQPPDRSRTLAALQKLHALDRKFITGEFQQGKVATAASSRITVASLVERLNRAEAALDSNNLTSAVAEMGRFKTDWLEVEGVVKTKSKDTYVDVENNMEKAYGFLKASSADVPSAKRAIDVLKQDLQPYTGTLRYSLFDAAAILLREGLEAILVLVALLAFLTKSGNGDKSRWLWAGAGAGILASIVTALAINLMFSQIGGANRELMEGITGLVAATMLFYVSYWLHTNSSLSAWQGYIRNQVNSALAKNSLLSLAFLAFLAVFREGAETTLFYVGLAPAIGTTDLFLGLALGTVMLAVTAVLILGLGLRIPLKPFFLVTSVLIYYLGFKFIGAGIHSLQVAGIVSATPANFLPSVEGLGIYPTWETTLPQLAVLLAAFAVVVFTRQKLVAAETAVEERREVRR
jgi:high-affinity iron transporter